MATPLRFGKEFLVNTITTNLQVESSITALADGRFAVCWKDQSGTSDPNSASIRAQIFNADGSIAGQSFMVNTTTFGVQELPDITALPDGRLVVCWQDQSASGGDTSLEAIRAQIFNVDGSKSGSEFVVNTTTKFDQRDPAIATLTDGRFVVTWKDGSLSPDDSGQALRGQVFNADGSKSGTEFHVNSTILGEQSDPTVTSLANGGFVISWTDGSATGGPGGDPSGRAIRAQVFDGNGAVVGGGPDFVVNQTTAGDQIEASVAALAGGGFVVSWTDGALATVASNVRARVFDADGDPVTAEFEVNTATAGNQHDSAVAALADGRIVICWVDTSPSGGDTSGSAIRAQVFNVDGTKSGTEFLVNTITHSHQLAPAIDVLADGRFTITWTDNSFTLGSNSAQDIRGQIFDPREAAVNLQGTALGDQWFGTRFDDRMSGAAGGDLLRGGVGNDRLIGGNGIDRLLGGANADKLTGGLGRDKLTGDAGADDFIFNSANETGVGSARDIITDFEHLQDDIDLSGFVPGGSFIGNAAFGNVAGQVRYASAAGILQGDTDGNGTADFEISLAGKPVLSADDILF